MAVYFLFFLNGDILSKRRKKSITFNKFDWLRNLKHCVFMYSNKLNWTQPNSGHAFAGHGHVSAYRWTSYESITTALETLTTPPPLKKTVICVFGLMSISEQFLC